jgi:L-lactate dehydrogenase complex protein LldG
MSLARDEILSRIRMALGEGLYRRSSEAGSTSGTPSPQDTDRHAGQPDSASNEDLLDLLQHRLQDYRAEVIRCGLADLPAAIAGRLTVRRATTVVIPPGIPDTWISQIQGSDLSGQAGVQLRVDRATGPLTPRQLDSLDAALTGCALAIAETGTLVLDSGASQGRRALSLIPDYHLCVVFEGQVVETVTEAVGTLEASVSQSPHPLTLISGPSATSDIELIRVEGVHGPRTLDVILVEGS